MPFVKWCSIALLVPVGVALSGCGTQAPSTPTRLAVTTFEAASTVSGQPDFTSDTAATTQTGLCELYGNPALVNGVFYAPDDANNRVLGYLDGIPASNGAAADFVLGQPDFTSTAGSSASTGLAAPATVFGAAGKLFVTDWANSRVLIWNTPRTTSQAPADIVVGQSGFNASSHGCSASTMNYPISATATSSKLIVADQDNNRVLIYDNIPTSNGAAADIVLGQGDFTHVTYNDDNQDGAADATPSARTMYYPEGLLVTSNALVVADGDNNRYLVFRP